MPNKTVVAAIIAGPAVKSEGKEDFERCLKSLEGHVNMAFIAFNCIDAVAEPLPVLPDLSYKVIMRHHTWDDDFSKSRNDSFQMVHDFMQLSQKHFDWILWIDTDDTLEGGENIQPMLESLDDNTQAVFMRYDYAVDPDTETVLAVQWRERMMRTDGNFRWHYPIHEICHAPPGTQYARKDQVWIRHWRQPKRDNKATRERNRRILTAARKAFPNEPRFLYYMANEVYAEAGILQMEGKDATAVIEAGIKAYEDFIPDAPSPDDAYLAAHQIGELRRMKKDFIGAIEAELQAMMVHPTWPDAYVGIAQAYMEIQEFEKQEFWARACLKNTTAQHTSQVREPLNNEYIPRLLLGIALEEQGNFEDAKVEYKRIAEWNLTSEIEDRLAAVEEKMVKNVTIMAPVIDIQKPVRKKLFSSQNEKSIAFFTRPLFEPWHPEIIKGDGIGGAETCVIEVAKRFRADGWRTVVFGTPGQYRGVDQDGIEWWDSNEFLPTEEFTVFVSSRCVEVFDAPIKAKLRLLWMHDVNIGDTFSGPFGARGDNIDLIVGLSDWHLDHLHNLYRIPRNRLAKIPNGVDLSRFDNAMKGNRQNHKFVWSSSPDRGLDVVLNFWPRIKKRWNDAELHVYYGWNSIDKIIAQSTESIWLEGFKNSINSTIDELGGEKGGIFWHDRVSQDVLAQELMTCDMWLYPTYFMETFCITAIEAQAAGVIPLTSDVAALRETVAVKRHRVEGWPNNITFNIDYITRLEEIINSPNKEYLRALGRSHARDYSWDLAFDKWKEVCGFVLEPEEILA